MGRLVWDAVAKKKYNYGISRCVLFLYDENTKKWKGEAWNGVISISESPDGAKPSNLYADNAKYSVLRSAETFSGKIKAYMTPRGWAECVGEKQIGTGMRLSGQTRRTFCLCYRTEQGNDMDSEMGFRLHIVYNCTVNGSEKKHQTKSNNADVSSVEYDIKSTPVPIPGHKAASHITVDSTALTRFPGKLRALGSILYGNSKEDAWLPPPEFFLAASYEDLGIFVLDRSALDSNTIV